MATSNPLVRDGKYDGARNSFIVDENTLAQNARRLEMSTGEYIKHIQDFVKSYSQNPLFAYEHTDLSNVPVRFEAYMSESDAKAGKARAAEGSYNLDSGRVSITPNRDPEVMLRTLIHEMNHAAMFPPGGPAAPDSRYSPQHTDQSKLSAFLSDPVTPKVNYGPGELAAFIAETSHASTRLARNNNPIVSILSEWMKRHSEVTSDLRSRSAQPTRPETKHPQSEIEDTVAQRLMQLLTGRSPRDR